MKKTIRRSLQVILILLFLYLGALIYPNWLFVHHLSYRNFDVFSDRPIPKAVQFVLDDALYRLEYSELYDTEQKFRLFICHDTRRFAFFTRNPNAGGVVNFLISPNIFIRKSDLENNRLIPPSGWMYQPKERPLSYFIAHEATHSLERTVSPMLVLTTPVSILEGYADYIAKRPSFDFDTYRTLYRNDDFVMNPKNGLYNRYHLYIAQLMDNEGLSFKEILQQKPDLETTLERLK